MSNKASKPATHTSEIRFGGVGGQGIVLAGRLLGMAAAIYDGKHAVCTQTYGPEARGGASRADVVISDSPVDYPFVTEADVLAVFFQEAYTKFRSRVKPDGVLIIDSSLVRPSEDDKKVFGIPATKIADELGNRVITNVVMLGYLVGKTGVVSRESVENAIRATVKQKVIDIDLKAFDAGYSLALEDKAA